MSTLDPIVFVVPGDPKQRTGGYLYDAHMVQALDRAGHSVSVVGLAGQFPMPDQLAKDSLRAVLLAHPKNTLVIIDGLALGGLGETAQAVRQDPAWQQKNHLERARWVALVHHPLADETGLDKQQSQWLWQQEKLALAHCDQVIVTSPFTASRLVNQGYVDTPPTVVTPGVAPAPLAQQRQLKNASQGTRMLSVASLTPRKGHRVLLQALHLLKDLNWVSEWIGDATRDPVHAHQLMQLITELGLDDRVVCWGEQDADQLAKRYDVSDVCVLPSFYEGYGMVITEAIARGLPVITTDGGALPDTLPVGAGLIVPAGDAQALAEALRAWCEDASLRQSLTQGAIKARASLADWSESGQRFIAALKFNTLKRPVQ